jgi:hypothetical protein
MTEQEIRDNAPSGATHYYNGEYYQWSDDDGLFKFDDGDWFWEDYFLEDWINPL